MQLSKRSLVTAALALTAVAPARARCEKRDLDLSAPDGIKLKASFFASAKPGPGVLLLHQCGNGGRKPWDNLATQLSSAGFNVLTLDYRGFGESAGERFESLDAKGRRAAQERWPGDFDAAFDYLRSQPGVDKTRIGAGGASCGANSSVQLSIRHPEVKSLALLSGGTDQTGLEHIRRADWLPIFAAASADDHGFVPYMGWLLLFSRNPSSRLMECRRAGHGTDMFAVEKGLEPLIVEWFGKTLSSVPAAGAAGMSRDVKPHPMVEFWSLLTGPDGLARASVALREARKRDPGAVLFPELAVLMRGWELLQARDAQGAVEALRLGLEAYPSSPSLYYSLASAHLETGDHDQALECTQKTLQLLERDTTLSPEYKESIRQRALERLKQLKP